MPFLLGNLNSKLNFHCHSSPDLLASLHLNNNKPCIWRHIPWELPLRPASSSLCVWLHLSYLLLPLLVPHFWSSFLIITELYFLVFNMSFSLNLGTYQWIWKSSPLHAGLQPWTSMHGTHAFKCSVHTCSASAPCHPQPISSLFLEVW